MHVVLNLIALIVELALIAGAAYIGAREPVSFAVLTAALALTAGLTLEYARLSHEMPFYFGRALAGVTAVLARVWTSCESVLKASVAGLVALLTFSGTNPDRLYWTSLLFAACLLVGTTALLRISFSWGEKALRWGYFRLAMPLGLLFSAGLYALTQAGMIANTSLGSLAYTATFELARNPSIADASEFLFRLSQATDNLIASLLRVLIPADYVPIVQIVASTNVLPGFVLAVYVVAIVRVVYAIYHVGGRGR